VSLPLHVTDLLAQGTADVLDEPFRMIALPLALNWTAEALNWTAENQELVKLKRRERSRRWAKQ
jgi:hypothetical protein